MSTFSVTASGNSYLRTGWYGYNIWRDDENGSAFQGTYAGADTTMPYPRVGLIHFNEAGSTLEGKDISSITITTVPGASGYGNDTYKTLYIYESNYQYIDQSIPPANYIGNALGTIYGSFYRNTSTFVLSPDSNSEVFSALKSYFESGNSQICIFVDEDIISDYSANYLCVTSVSITIEYSEGGCVRIWNGTEWVKYIPHIWDGSKWVKYSPYIWDGSKWVLYGG